MYYSSRQKISNNLKLSIHIASHAFGGSIGAGVGQ